jgi:hypothetical protein
MNLAENDPYQASDFLIEQPDGTYRVGGCLPRKWAPEASPFQPWGSTDTVAMVPQSEWIEQESLRGYETWQRDINQQSYPACCLASLANAMQFSMVRDGRPVVELDWLAAWRKLSGGRGGVALDDAADYARTNGFPRLDGKGTVKIREAWDCPSTDALASALERGALCTFGHDMHAEAALRLVKQNGVWNLDVRNSWGRDWGDRGWHFLPLSNVEMRYSIIAIRELEFVE